MDAGVSQTWAATLGAPAENGPPLPVVGYFTLTQSVVKREDLPTGIPTNKYPSYPLSVIKLAWLGVDQNHQGGPRRHGETLLIEALNRAYQIFAFSEIGIAVVVDPLTDESDRFFSKYGFQQLSLAFGNRQSLYLPMGTVKELIESDESRQE